MTLWLPELPPAGGPPAARRGTRALFLDRDGVIIEDAHYLHDPGGVRLLPGVAPALRRMRDAGWLLIGVSNQSGIGRGLYGEREFAAVQRRVDAELASRGAWLDALYYCPHAPQAACACRKPEPGLLQEAAARFHWTPERSWLVGDKATDIELARRAGLSACLVLTGRESGTVAQAAREASTLVCADLSAAVAHILAEETP